MQKGCSPYLAICLHCTGKSRLLSLSDYIASIIISSFTKQVRELDPFARDLGFTVEEYAANKGTIPPR